MHVPNSGVLSVSYERPEQPLDLIAEACANLELTLGTEIHLALNCAGPELMDYVSQSQMVVKKKFRQSVRQR